MLLNPVQQEISLPQPLQPDSINTWRCSYVTPVSKQGSYVEFLNHDYITEPSNSNSMYFVW